MEEERERERKERMMEVSLEGPPKISAWALRFSSSTGSPLPNNRVHTEAKQTYTPLASSRVERTQEKGGDVK